MLLSFRFIISLNCSHLTLKLLQTSWVMANSFSSATHFKVHSRCNSVANTFSIALTTQSLTFGTSFLSIRIVFGLHMNFGVVSFLFLWKIISCIGIRTTSSLINNKMKLQASPGLIQSRHTWNHGTGNFAQCAGAANYTAAHWRLKR